MEYMLSDMVEKVVELDIYFNITKKLFNLYGPDHLAKTATKRQ